MAKGVLLLSSNTGKPKIIVSDPEDTRNKIGETLEADTLVEVKEGNYVEWSLRENERKEMVPTITKVLSEGKVVTSNSSNVTVKQGEAVLVRNGASITGTTLIDGGSLLVLDQSKAAGNLQVKNGGFVYCNNSTVSGTDFRVDGSNAAIIIINCRVNGKLNTGSNRVVTLIGNETKSITSANDAEVVIKQNTVQGDLFVTGATTCELADNTVSGSTHTDNC